MSEAAEDGAGFGAKDLGGPKHASPSQATTPDAGLVNESIKRMAWSRKFAFGALVVMSASAVGCLGFAMYVGCHFLGAFDKHQADSRDSGAMMQQSAPVQKSSAPADQKLTAKAASTKTPTETSAPFTADTSAATSNEKLYFTTLAPLIPASFSSALAIILFITIARFVTNFERIGKENTEKEAPEDYGAIATLVQEVGKLIKTLRGK